jgi:hypothetical protein
MLCIKYSDSLVEAEENNIKVLFVPFTDNIKSITYDLGVATCIGINSNLPLELQEKILIDSLNELVQL